MRIRPLISKQLNPSEVKAVESVSNFDEEEKKRILIQKINDGQYLTKEDKKLYIELILKNKIYQN
jgi:hypothetical protein